MVEIPIMLNSGNNKQIKTNKQNLPVIVSQSGWQRGEWFYTSPLYYQPATEKLFVRARKSGLQWSWNLFLDEHMAEMALLRKGWSVQSQS